MKFSSIFDNNITSIERFYIIIIFVHVFSFAVINM